MNYNPNEVVLVPSVPTAPAAMISSEAHTYLGLLIVAILFGLYLPNATYLHTSNRLAEILNSEGATLRGDAVMIDYKETSLAFYQGGTIRPMSDNDFLVHTPPIEWPRWIVLTDAIWKRMPEEIRSKLEVIGTVHGLNYAGKDADKHHVIDVHVLRRKPGAWSLPTTAATTQ